MPTTFQNVLLAQFEPDIARQLIAFGEGLAKLEADVFIFVARKSIRLYDILTRLGILPIEACVVSDRVLDMCLDPLRGKRVVLIDDTLIVGTSLAKAKIQLERAGATVTTHVFCLNQAWHVPEILVPDFSGVELANDRVMTFCTAEVRAMALAAIPYLVDFPMSKPVRLHEGELSNLISTTEWSVLKLTTELQVRHDVSTLTLLPGPEVLTELEKVIGSDLAKCVEIAKVRMWARKSGESWFVQTVPIATLCPVSEIFLATFSTHLLQALLGRSPTTERLDRCFNSSRARQRLCQFILSVIVGRLFFQGAARRLERNVRWQFDQVENDRHFGPWLHDDVTALVKATEDLLIGRPLAALPKFQRAPIPAEVERWTATSIGTNTSRTRLRTKQRRDRSVSLLADFAEVFHRIYDNREIPARKEAQRLGARYLDPNSDAPNRDRLEKGVPWTLLVKWMADLCEVSITHHVTNTFSLLLDLCNDVGIAVPVTCVQDGIVYRGYRHGEDVKFSDGELALAYDATEGFLQATKLQAIPRLTFEKLLVLLLKIGVSRGFLQVLYGREGTDGICRIGFDLKGARPLLTRGPRLRAERDLWLTDYLVSRQVVTTSSKGRGKHGQYLLGRRPEGNYVVSHAPDEAKDLGNIVGMLMRRKRGEAPALGDREITLLTTCATPTHALQALQAELSIFRDWFPRIAHAVSDGVTTGRLEDPKWIADTVKAVQSGAGYEALHSAQFKYVGFMTDECRSIIESAARALASPEAPIFERRWRSYWAPLSTAKLNDERRTMLPLIETAADHVWELFAYVSIIEIALRFQQRKKSSSSDADRLTAAIAKLRDFRTAMGSAKRVEPKRAREVVERLLRHDLLLHPEKSAQSDGFRPAEAMEFALKATRSLLHDVDSLIDMIDPVVDEYGKKADRIDYAYMVYYDIVDSTATTAVRRGVDAEDHRRQCSLLKDYVNRWLERAVSRDRSAAGEMASVNGSKSSSNDCKHIFFRGNRALANATEVVTMLIEAASTFQMLARISLVPCNFAGTLAYRRAAADPEIVGSRFWEHWSRLAKGASSLEASFPGKHFFLVATNELVEGLRLNDRLQWMDQEDGHINTEIEYLQRQTAVRYGELRRSADAG